MKITEATTVVELERYKAQLGVKTLHCEAAEDRRLVVVIHPQHGRHVHVAGTEAAALDGAFSKLVAAIGAALEETLS